MRTVRGLLGVLGVNMAGGRFDATSAQTVATLADQAAVALERVKLANEAARSAAMEETQKLRTALLNSLSHDLRTPLTGIRGAADTLGSTWDRLTPATRADLLASIKEDTARMTRFLANIMDLTRLESGQVSPRLAPVQALHVIDAAIARVPDADNVLVNVPPDLPALRADPALLEQVLVNVLDNAVRYAPLGSDVRIRGSAGAGQVSLEVIDEGVGISAEDLPHVFDSFYRARRGDRTAPGTGLGLAIARGMMEGDGRHDRGHQPASGRGKGRFARNHCRAAAFRHSRACAHAGRIGLSRLNRTRILVIDDEPQIHRFLRPALEASGYEVERADTAAQGLALARAHAPALILLDLGLPDMDGQDALIELRAMSQVPVLILSARDQEAGKVAALDNGADDYVGKAVRPRRAAGPHTRGAAPCPSRHHRQRGVPRRRPSRRHGAPDSRRIGRAGPAQPA